MSARADRARAQGSTLVLVPTMGALHAGHMALVRRARQEGDHVTVSIFVNPIQFSPDEDFIQYPRDLEADYRNLADNGGVDIIFAPHVDDLYPGGITNQAVWVTSPDMSVHLCGKFRPGHFKGVLTVVAKLLAICKPHTAVFGLKDAQQFFMISRLSRDLSLGIRIIGEPTVRESDGLALSSRNAYLTKEERIQARAVSRAVIQARMLIESGEQHASAVVAEMIKIITRAPLAIVQYAEIVCTSTLQPVTRLVSGSTVLAAVAVFFGQTRLIDNTIVEVPR